MPNTEDAKQKIIELDGISTQNEFVRSEYAYIEKRYGAYGKGYKGVYFCLKPFAYSIAEVELMDGTKEILTFKIPKGYFDMPEGNNK